MIHTSSQWSNSYRSRDKWGSTSSIKLSSSSGVMKSSIILIDSSITVPVSGSVQLIRWLTWTGRPFLLKSVVTLHVWTLNALWPLWVSLQSMLNTLELLVPPLIKGKHLLTGIKDLLSMMNWEYRHWQCFASGFKFVFQQLIKLWDTNIFSNTTIQQWVHEKRVKRWQTLFFAENYFLQSPTLQPHIGSVLRLLRDSPIWRANCEESSLSCHCACV